MLRDRKIEIYLLERNWAKKARQINGSTTILRPVLTSLVTLFFNIAEVDIFQMNFPNRSLKFTNTKLI